jgi:lipopolysaccharide/colanic/teichoic acid biosynthesis glycosyltransferase
VERYEPWHRQRLEVKPGITGLWQVSGRSHIGFDDWMRLDIEYLRCRSWSTDLRILFKTIPAVIARKGAY